MTRVEFTQDTFVTSEPGSNYSPDQLAAFLSLHRSGDLSHPHTVTYATMDDTAHVQTDYLHASGEIFFSPSQSSAEISVDLLANHRKESSASFFVVLSLNDSLPLQRGIQLGVRWNATVVINNVPAQRVYFPELPLVSNLQPNGDLASGTNLSSDLPLICITVS